MAADNRNAKLDGLRALAALSVVVFHVWLYQSEGPIRRTSFSDSLIFELRAGFLMFFVLSGFLVFRPFCRAVLGRAEAVDVRNYSSRRVARIAPAYFVAIVAAYVLIETAGDAPGRRSVDLEQLPLFFLLLQNYFPDTVLKLDAPTWTLAVEAVFYVLLPLLAITVWRLRSIACVVATIVAFVAIGLGWNYLVYVNEWGTVATHTPFPFLPYFALGMLVALLAEREVVLERSAAWLASAGLIAVVLNGYWHATDYSQSIWIEVVRDLPAGLGMAAILAAVTIGSSPGTGWLGARPLVWLALISYGLYLWHVPLIVWLNGHGLLPSSVLGGVAVALPIAIVAGAASWYVIERRFVERAGRRPRNVSATKS